MSLSTSFDAPQGNKLRSLGCQRFIDLYECDREVLSDPEHIQHIMVEAATLAGATIVEQAFHHFNPLGVSGVVVIAESHFAIHTWPEYGFAAVDCFTCGADLDFETAIAQLTLRLGSQRVTQQVVERGIDIYPHA